MPADFSPIQCARRLAEWEVNGLVRVTMSRVLAELVYASGVVVIPWVSGPVEGVLRAHVTKRLSAASWCMPGHRCRSRYPEVSTGSRADVTLLEAIQ